MFGELIITNLVFEVILFSNCSAVILKSDSIEEGITIGFASAKIEDAIRGDILRKAAILDAESKEKKKKR